VRRALVALTGLAGALAIIAAASAVSGRAEPWSTRNATAVEIRSPAAVSEALAAWCGTTAQADRIPNVVAGNPVHWVYVIPSDGADNLGGVASVMQADTESIAGWWRGQDATRVPRNDLATFSCGSQLDITTLRTSRSSSQLAPLEGRFAAIVDALDQAGLASSYTKYVVYYDGPTSEENVCGQGGSDSSGFGVAVVYYRSCVGVSTAGVAVHELVHTLGAVPRGAPHECTGENSAHTCDDERDLMYPSIGGEALSAKLLDPGRDDYYGHSGGWTDTQDSPWLVRLDSQTPLALTVSGPGSVSADVPGLRCAASCTTTWNAGQRLALTATPNAGARLVRWSGACSGAAGCTLSVAAGTTVSAVFAPVSFRLSVALSGKGAVRSSRAGITCRPRCSAAFPSFSPVRLTATPAKGWKLRSWSGACRGAKKTCTVPMRAATSARATFVRA
jgi:Divergent InlB B-repeat domain